MKTYLTENFKEDYIRGFKQGFEKQTGRPPTEAELQEGLRIFESFVNKAKAAGKVIGGALILAGIYYAVKAVVRKRRDNKKLSETKTTLKLTIANLVCENEILTREEKIEILSSIKTMSISEILDNLSEDDIESLYEQGISPEEIETAKIFN